MSSVSSKSWKSSIGPAGDYRRKPSSFRRQITADGSSAFMAEAGRYHLYVSFACPWAHRTLIIRHLKGLTRVISVTVVAPVMEDDCGWHFDRVNDPDPTQDATHLRDIYTLADPSYIGNITVPVLFDKKTRTIVNNESSEIIRMFNHEFDAFCETDEQRALDFYPDELREAIDEVNAWVYPTINNGVYRCGFAFSQDAYNQAFRVLSQGLDRAEALLGKQRYLASNSRITEADIRLFTTIARFDAVYHVHFKCTMGRIACNYPNLWNHALELYEFGGLGDATVNMDHIKEHYYMSHKHINPTQIVPCSGVPDFHAKHNRSKFSDSEM